MKLLLDAVAFLQIDDEMEYPALCVVSLDEDSLAYIDEMERECMKYDFKGIVSENPKVVCTFCGDNDQEKGQLTYLNGGQLEWLGVFGAGAEVIAEISVATLREKAVEAKKTGCVLDCRRYIKAKEDFGYENWMDALPPDLRATIQSDFLVAKAQGAGDDSSTPSPVRSRGLS